MTTDSIWQTSWMIASAYAFTGAAWPLKSLSAKARTPVVCCMIVALLVWPLFYFGPSVIVLAIIALHCITYACKLLNLGVESDYWRNQRFRDWLFYLIVPSYLVPRLHESVPLAGWGLALRTLLRGAIEMTAGVLLLAWAFGADLDRHSFWLHHAVMVVGAYLCGFDGLFVFMQGLLMTLGMRILPLSREPILAVTPADFWRRYNCEAGRLLREDCFLPLGGRRHPFIAIIVTFLLNGVLHEYLAWLLIGKVMGYQIAFFATHGVAVAVTFRSRPPRRAVWPFRLLTFAFVFISSTLFMASVWAIPRR